MFSSYFRIKICPFHIQIFARGTNSARLALETSMRGWESGIHMLPLASQSNYLVCLCVTYIYFLDTTTCSALPRKELTTLLRNLKLFTYCPFYRACYPKSPPGDFFFFARIRGSVNWNQWDTNWHLLDWERVRQGGKEGERKNLAAFQKLKHGITIQAATDYIPTGSESRDSNICVLMFILVLFTADKMRKQLKYPSTNE